MTMFQAAGDIKILRFQLLTVTFSIELLRWGLFYDHFWA